MDHLAIMNPKWRLIEKILSGEKTIESRWYVHKIAPWDRISKGDTVYFKDAGKQVSACATVSDVIQKELASTSSAITLVRKYQKQLCFTKDAVTNTEWLNKKKYGILIFLNKPKTITAFTINKKGYGSACAWICVESIKTITLS